MTTVHDMIALVEEARRRGVTVAQVMDERGLLGPSDDDVDYDPFD